jgi:hypothetical protein
VVRIRAYSDLDRRLNEGTRVPTPLELVFPDAQLREGILQASRLLALAGVEELSDPTAWAAIDIGGAMLSGEFMEEMRLSRSLWKLTAVTTDTIYSLLQPCRFPFWGMNSFTK